jgi:putative aldouronate transport system substrate-binding protein
MAALMTLSLFGAALSAHAEELPHVTLKFIFFADKKSDTDKVWAAIAEKYKDQLNCDFDVQFIPGDDYKQMLLYKAGAGDEWDMNFEGEWLGYFQMIAMDAYADLTELLPVYAPDLYEAYQSTGVLEAATYNGKIVCLPWTMMMNNRTTIQWRGDLAEAAGIVVDKENLTTIEDVYDLLAKLHEAYPERYIIESSSWDAMKIKYSLVEIGNGLVIDLNDPEAKVQAKETTEAFREYVAYGKKLQDEGLIWKDILNDKTDRNAMINEGTLITKWGTYEFARSGRPWVEEGAYWDYAFLYPDGKSPNRTPLANVAAVSATSNNVERVLMFMNLLQTDQELYDMMHYGIYGETYLIDEAGAVVYPEGMTTANSSFMGWQGRWAYWKPQFMRPDDEFPKDFWKEEAENAMSSPNNVPSPYDAFVFNAEDVNVEIAQRDQVFEDHKKLFDSGLIDGDPDAVVDRYIADQAINAEIIVTEAQRQLDAFLGK